MRSREVTDGSLAVATLRNPNVPPILGSPVAPDQSKPPATRHEGHDAVVLGLQELRHFHDSGPFAPGTPRWQTFEGAKVWRYRYARPNSPRCEKRRGENQKLDGTSNSALDFAESLFGMNDTSVAREIAFPFYIMA
jgi:hypothetical protein